MTPKLFVMGHTLSYYLFFLVARGRTASDATEETVEAHHHIRKLCMVIASLSRGSGMAADKSRQALVELLASLFHRGHNQGEQSEKKNSLARWGSGRRARCGRRRCGGCGRHSGGAEGAFCSFRRASSPPRRCVQVGGRLPLRSRHAA